MEGQGLWPLKGGEGPMGLCGAGRKYCLGDAHVKGGTICWEDTPVIPEQEIVTTVLYSSII